jgi:D-alanyl-D-alanine endopeptidase (penicillin-binding protein 7)
MKLLLIFLFMLVTTATVAHSESYALYHYGSNEYIESQDIERTRSIASITKLFTAIVVLRSGVDLDQYVVADCTSHGHVAKGNRVTTRDLLIATIVSSDNCAAESLANTYPGGFNRFSYDRKEYINGMGLIHTSLIDATGLSVFNMSTVADLVKFIGVAYQNETLRTIASLPNATITAYGKKNKKIVLQLHNTNPSVIKYNNIVLSKTGFTNSAGRCVVMLVRKFDTFFAVVILGEPNLRARTRVAEKLLSYETRTW